MKLADFSTPFEELGLNLGAYGGEAYYGASKDWSLALLPLVGDQIHHAKLAIRQDAAREKRVVVDTFLSAAEVEKTPQIEQALDNGREFRARSGAKEISFFAVGPDLVVNVRE
jgi:hypothetical protein